MIKENEGTKMSWAMDTVDYVCADLCEVSAVLTVMISNLTDFKQNDGLASDEVIFLSLQNVTAIVCRLEKDAYELEENTAGGIGGDLSLALMRSRALLVMIEDMINPNSWKIEIAASDLANYFKSVRRLLGCAADTAKNIHNQRHQKAA